MAAGWFEQELARLGSGMATGRPRTWVYVAPDQLSDRIGPLARTAPNESGIVMVESRWQMARRPYHRQRLALVMANMRHFALEQARRGVAVRYAVHEGSPADALREVVRDTGPLVMMEAAEREQREDLRGLVASGAVRVAPHEGWLATAEDLARSAPGGPPFRMDAFYRVLRRRTGILMRDGAPIGGKFSFDTDNRRPWKGEPAAPEPPRFPRDPVKDEVATTIAASYAAHPGTLDIDALPATDDDAEALWRWAGAACLTHFGPFEDAMSTESTGLFHTRISPLLNLHRLLPARVVADVAAMDLPIASQEGFIRQVLGWREFVHQVHRATDGFRALPGAATTEPRAPGDGGFARWAGQPWEGAHRAGDPCGGATPAHLGQGVPLPPAWWGTPSGMACLDHVVASVWREGWSHHITRLMVLSNLAALLDLSPRDLTDWFWVAYTDAWDWVVEPNVLAMGTFATGPLMTTKPYVSGTPYLEKMGDYCGECAFDPKRDCPISALYWAYLARHREKLAGVERLRMPLASEARRTPAQRDSARRTHERVRAALAAGKRVTPQSLAAK